MCLHIVISLQWLDRWWWKFHTRGKKPCGFKVWCQKWCSRPPNRQHLTVWRSVPRNVITQWHSVILVVLYPKETHTGSVSSTVIVITSWAVYAGILVSDPDESLIGNLFVPRLCFCQHTASYSTMCLKTHLSIWQYVGVTSCETWIRLDGFKIILCYKWRPFFLDHPI